MGTLQHDYVGLTACGAAHTDGMAPLQPKITHTLNKCSLSDNIHTLHAYPQSLLMKPTMAEHRAVAAATQTPHRMSQSTVYSAEPHNRITTRTKLGSTDA
jgi:hypothetical protein